MRVRPTSADACAKHAKTLKRALEGLGVDTTLSAAQNAVGRMHGYRTWHEMALAARAPGRPSPEDEDVPIEEAAARRAHQAQVLVEAYGLNPVTAGNIVTGIQPTARKRPGQARDPIVAAEQSWRNLLRERRNAHGFVTFDPTGWSPPSLALGMPFPFEGSGVTVQAWIEIVGEANRKGAVALKVTAAATAADGPVGIMTAAGACIVNRLGGEPAMAVGRRASGIFTAIGDAFGPEERLRVESALNLASLHLGPADMGSADGIIRVSAWETAHGRAPRDCGLALLAAADAAVRAAGYRHGGFLLDLAPRQFDGLAHRDRMRRLDYRAARTRLEDHLIRGIERTSWQGSGFVVYEPEPGPEGATTVTADDEPRPMADDEYPEGFGLDRIVYLPGCRWVAPHARFWSAMPSELRSVSVEYREGRLEQGGPLETWDHLIDFAFANGSVLRAFVNDIELHREDRSLPKPLTLDGEVPLPSNPYTDRMSVGDMYGVLAANIWLLFTCGDGPAAPARGRVTVTRPKG